MTRNLPEKMRAPLFRSEALQAIQPQQFGEIVLVPGASSRWLAAVSLLVCLALVVLLTQGSYTRRTTVSGQLLPSEGLIRVTAAQAGVVVENKVRDGQVVEKGEVLFVLSGDRLGPDDLAFQRDMASQIEARRRSLEADSQRTGSAEKQEAEQLRQRLSSLRAEGDQVARQEQQLILRVNGAQDAQRRYEGLFKQGYASRDELLVKEAELTELRTRLQGSRREALVLQRDMVATQRDLDALRTRYANQRSELQRAVLTARQEFTELEARRRIVVTAPADGRVTLLQADVGQSVEAAKPLAHLVPVAARLVARLYAPSRSAGFVRSGAPVLLRFDAFPYQKFGQYTGTVVSVSVAGMGGTDIQGQAQRPEWVGESLFAITVSLPTQLVGDAEQKLALQAGMRVDADLLHETRRLYEWILEPLYAARARLGAS
jgi:membrane fusion protein